jgi:hypothetical protein
MRYVSLYAHYYRAGLYVIWCDHQLPVEAGTSQTASKQGRPVPVYGIQIVGVSSRRPYPSELVWIYMYVLRTSQAKQNGKITNTHKGYKVVRAGHKRC